MLGALTWDRSRWGLLLLWLWVGLSPVAGAAQAPLVGMVVDGGSGAPLAGVFVTLEARGVEGAAGAVLTDEAGRFVLLAQPRLEYRLRAERVGLRTEVTDWFDFQGGAAPRRIEMAERAVELEGLDVRAPVRTCRLSAAEATVVQRWWDEVRKALQVTAFGESKELSGLRFERFEREWSSNLRALRSERDLPEDSTPVRPFFSADAETLSRGGFIQGREGERVFLAPDAAVLFSRTFLSDHCLRVAHEDEAEPESGEGDSRRGHDLRLVVEPTREEPSDIRGVLTVDTLSSELRAFDFTYVNLPQDLPRTRGGGHLEFAYLPSGEWVVSEWWVRLPRIARRWGEGSGWGAIPVVTGYLDQGGRALGADGRRVDSALSAERGAIHGVVYDSLSGGPLSDARVSVVGSRYATTTGADGRFTLTGIPAGTRAVTFYHPELTRRGLPSPVFVVDVDPAGEDRLELAAPGFASAARLICPEGQEGPEAVLTGTVASRAGSPAPGAARIRAWWAGEEGDMRAEGVAGSDGRYVFCGLPVGVPVSMAVRADSSDWRDAGTVELAAGRISVHQLRPGAEARAVVRGTVRGAESGTAIDGASVWLLAPTGDTVVSVRVDSEGAFQVTVPPGVGYRAVASKDGYLREASAAFTLHGAESLDVAFELVGGGGALTMKIQGLVVEVDARNRAVAKNLLKQYGQSEPGMGRRWIGVATLDSIPSTGERDPGVAISRQAIPGVWVDQAAKHGLNPHLCVRQKSGGCALIVFNGAVIDRATALLLDFGDLEGIAVLDPQDATTFFGTRGGGGAVVLWTRGSGR